MKTLHMQGDVTEDVRDICNELIQNNLFVENLIEDTAEHSINSTIIIKEHISTLNNTLIKMTRMTLKLLKTKLTNIEKL